MKKALSIITLGVMGVFLMGSVFVSAQEDLDSWVDSLLGDESFGYSSSDRIEVVSISKASVEVESPVVQGELGEDILDYAIMYGQYPIEEAMENPDLLDDFGEKEINLGDNPGSKFTIELDADDDDIDPHEIYYALILPKDEFGLPGEISNDICFVLDTQVYGFGTECEDSAGAHAAGGADMNLANITHAINDDRITLSWTELEGADEIELFLWDPDDERFEELATVDMSDEKYVFTSNRNGEHNVKFIPYDNGDVSGTEIIYTFTVTTLPETTTPTPTTTPTTTTTGITKVPVVGPTENVIAVIAISVVAYLAYRLFSRRKAK